MPPKERLLYLLPFRSLTAAMELADAFDEGPEDAPMMGPDDMAEWIFELEDERRHRCIQEAPCPDGRSHVFPPPGSLSHPAPAPLSAIPPVGIDA